MQDILQVARLAEQQAGLDHAPQLRMGAQVAGHWELQGRILQKRRGVVLKEPPAKETQIFDKLQLRPFMHGRLAGPGADKQHWGRQCQAASQTDCLEVQSVHRLSKHVGPTRHHSGIN
eukprot:3610854-Heterocapsa_arctica.AAC.1